MTEQEIVDRARTIIRQRSLRTGSRAFENPADVKKFLFILLRENKNELFAVAFLDNRHRLISYEELFYGTVDGSSVYPRVIMQRALELNAVALVLVHNHPAGVAEPSQADRSITKRIIEASNLMDMRVLDHFVVGDSVVSFAEKGML